MNVNGVPQTLATLNACVQAILDRLEIVNADAPLRQRIATFIQCNGYRPVWQAATATMVVHRRKPVADRWDRLVRLFNHTIIFLGQLYTYTHWIEAGLRSQVDLAYCAHYGSNWYLFPDHYLPKAAVAPFVADSSMPVILWDPTQKGSKSRLTSLETSGHFLEGVSFGWLIQIVNFRHRENRQSILVQPNGAPLPFLRAESLLGTAKDARNDVAHNRLITEQKFLVYESAMCDLLAILRFDVERALDRVEKRREVLIPKLRENRARKSDSGPKA